mmetsp:Transcript_3542/g.3903  ORF Transcript_3542/g.3903 Transcript_3542/m.3903 type:complete len:83 (+) Transcript_3542:477-725(+)
MLLYLQLMQVHSIHKLLSPFRQTPMLSCSEAICPLQEVRAYSTHTKSSSIVLERMISTMRSHGGVQISLAQKSEGFQRNEPY